QYTYARINSVLTKGGYSPETEIVNPAVFKETELDLIQLLDSFPEKIEASAKEFSPAQIANYIFDLSKLYNKFYHEESILKAEQESVKNFRLKLSKVTATTIEKGMKLLGINVPERM